MSVRIAITGNTAVGTTTLTEIISQYMDLDAVYSEVFFNGSPFFRKFLVDPKKYCFRNQIHFINEYYDSYLKCFEQNGICLDFHIYEIRAYTRAQYMSGYLDKNEFESIEGILNKLDRLVVLPDLSIYVKADIDTILKRILGRDRFEENKIEREYLANLQIAFDEMFGCIKNGLVLSSTEYNFYLDEDISVVKNKIKNACNIAPPSTRRNLRTKD